MVGVGAVLYVVGVGVVLYVVSVGGGLTYVVGVGVVEGVHHCWVLVPLVPGDRLW